MNSPASVLLLFAALSAFVTFDAFRAWDLKRLLVFAGLTLVLLAASLFSSGSVPGNGQPATSRLQREFGPEWDCSSGSICIRKSPLK